MLGLDWLDVKIELTNSLPLASEDVPSAVIRCSKGADGRERTRSLTKFVETQPVPDRS